MDQAATVLIIAAAIAWIGFVLILVILWTRWHRHG